MASEIGGRGANAGRSGISHTTGETLLPLEISSSTAEAFRELYERQATTREAILSACALPSSIVRGQVGVTRRYAARICVREDSLSQAAGTIARRLSTLLLLTIARITEEDHE
jgi:hypothetical protein